MEKYEVSLCDYINAVEDFEDELDNLNRLVDNLNEVSNLINSSDIVAAGHDSVEDMIVCSRSEFASLDEAEQRSKPTSEVMVNRYLLASARRLNKALFNINKMMIEAGCNVSNGFYPKE